jgi:hypothetical protein
MQAIRRPKQQPAKAARTKVKSGAAELEEDQGFVTAQSSLQLTQQFLQAQIAMILNMRSVERINSAWSGTD